jgi:hypothetical protein
MPEALRKMKWRSIGELSTRSIKNKWLRSSVCLMNKDFVNSVFARDARCEKGCWRQTKPLCKTIVNAWSVITTIR